jgi:hypothetical protein
MMSRTFDGRHFAVEYGGAKLPLGERVQYDFCLREPRGKNDRQVLETASGIDAAMHHNGGAARIEH